MKKILTIALAAVIAAGSAIHAKTPARAVLGRPDLEAIERATTDESSPRFYPRLLRAFMANDTSMTAEDFQYFYYGTFFQEDYDPYREAPNPALQQELIPIYAKAKRTRADREKMLDYALQVLDDNPVDLRQLTNRIYVYEQNRKYDLAKIWQYKLNHLLLVIASSGTGVDPDNAFVVVYPQHEYDFLNLSGITAESQRFEPPFFDYISVEPTKTKTSPGYYFNIDQLLRQYFVKHPGELKAASMGADE
ncbi:MAG: DUF4919 domain-containing protein [Muribaculaceae bacterium]|nr:DUF4919 domain-containing protein [Muribaculaceae bacterium]